jgi:hypothetical protein
MTMRADGQLPGQPNVGDLHRRRGNAIRPRRWPHRRALMRMPGGQQRALARIEQALVAEDPGLSLRFAFFARLTVHEAMPPAEQVPGRLQLFLRRVTVLLLLAIGLAALLAACWLIPGSEPACPAGPTMAAHGLSSLGRAAHCQPGPATRLDTMPMH